MTFRSTYVDEQNRTYSEFRYYVYDITNNIIYACILILDQNDNMNHGYTYFVIDGVCSVVQKITLRVRTGFGGRKLFAIPENENSNNHRDTIFVTIRYFSSGDCFGLGRFVFSIITPSITVGLTRWLGGSVARWL